METIKEVKDYLRENFEKGTDCPCCGQFVKQYRRKLNSGMAIAMLKIYKLCANGEYYNISNELIGIHQLEYSKLRYWKLIESKNNENGLWKPTKQGIDFVVGKCTIPKYAYVYNNKLIKLEGEQISIKDALGDHFDYNELMGYDN